MYGIHTGLLEEWKKQKKTNQDIRTKLSSYGYTDEEKDKVRADFADYFYKSASNEISSDEIDWMKYPVYFLLNTGLGKKDQYHDLSNNLWKCWKSNIFTTSESKEVFLDVLSDCLNEMSPMIFEYYSSLHNLYQEVQMHIKKTKNESPTPLLQNELDDNGKTEIGQHKIISGVRTVFAGTTFAVLELEGDAIYETDEYEIWIDGQQKGKDNKMVLSIYDLSPDTIYTIELKNKIWVQKILLHTETETVTVNVMDFGAAGDGSQDDTTALQTAVLACPKGGRVYIPAGTYRFYQLFLKSNITIELAQDAVLSAYSTMEHRPVLPGFYEREDLKDKDGRNDIYDLASWEGNPLDCYASILTGIEVENVVICGKGTIDGGGDFVTWWVNEKKYPVMEQKKTYRPKMCFLNRCKNIILQGVTFANSPCWNMHPYFSEHICYYDIKLQSPAKSHNTDGIDPESCKDVEILGVHFSVGDDCIAIKSGKIYMGAKRKAPSQNISIRQCLMERGHGAVTIGSEIAGGVKDVYVTKCRFLETDRGLRIKTRRGRGKDSIIDNIVFENIFMDKVKSPFVVNEFYYCDPDGKSEYVSTKKPLPVDERTPEIKSIRIDNVVCKDAAYAGIYMYGLPEKKISSVEINNTTISFDPEAKMGKPAMMVGCDPVSRLGLFIENVENKKINNVNIEGALDQ